ncbi:helix-turn-helix domain-containing protein [Pseudomonas sp. 2023EL-01195]|uniref:helix-turn-helix domain-containing protein n=1 Tax=Pseudomonas sp. 2023EL-01195 TaxID=3088134 RepID=UPI0009DB84E0|nr:helix-turn-helix domain-containing protein [Pseudomonas sp. 2023EL-01195]MDW3714107.1 helix-turn-helix domain-containing protein [Pseudomonas sp. 2023EL-01195]
MNISERLKQARKHAGLTQSELAERAGITQASVSELERGLSRSSAHLVKLAMVCGVRPQWLAEGVGSMEPAPGPGSIPYRIAQEKIGDLNGAIARVKEEMISGASVSELELAKVVFDNSIKAMSELRERITESMKNESRLGDVLSRIQSPRALAVVERLAELAASGNLSDADLGLIEATVAHISRDKEP